MVIKFKLGDIVDVEDGESLEVQNAPNGVKSTSIFVAKVVETHKNGTYNLLFYDPDSHQSWLEICIPEEKLKISDFPDSFPSHLNEPQLNDTFMVDQTGITHSSSTPDLAMSALDVVPDPRLSLATSTVNNAVNESVRRLSQIGFVHPSFPVGSEVEVLVDSEWHRGVVVAAGVSGIFYDVEYSIGKTKLLAERKYKSDVRAYRG